MKNFVCTYIKRQMYLRLLFLTMMHIANKLFSEIFSDVADTTFFALLLVVLKTNNPAIARTENNFFISFELIFC